jgi:Pyruvate/2-oxoacid:ferredoxin oxidoreductase delta subunit
MLETLLFIIVGLLFIAVIIFWLIGEHWRPLLPSTRNFMRQAGWKRFLSGSNLHAYVYGRWTREYIHLALNYLLPHLGERGKQRWADHYHGKVLTKEQARNIITIDQDIPLQDLEKIIPYPAARDLVLKGPPDVVVFSCPCRQIRANPCEPIQVCMVIGQPFADFILEHHPQSSRRLTQTEALELLEAEHQRGHLHSAWFKDVMLDRFYVICNCCKCCCGGIELMVKHKAPTMSSSGYVARVDESLCTGCKVCELACPFAAIQAEGTAVVNWDACMGCGVCVGQCPNKAVWLDRDERKGVPLDVRVLH